MKSILFPNGGKADQYYMEMIMPALTMIYLESKFIYYFGIFWHVWSLEEICMQEHWLFDLVFHVL